MWQKQKTQWLKILLNTSENKIKKFNLIYNINKSYNSISIKQQL